MTKMRYSLNHLFGGRFLVQILLRKVPKSSIMVVVFHLRLSFLIVNYAQKRNSDLYFLLKLIS